MDFRPAFGPFGLKSQHLPKQPLCFTHQNSNTGWEFHQPISTQRRRFANTWFFTCSIQYSVACFHYYVSTFKQLPYVNKWWPKWSILCPKTEGKYTVFFGLSSQHHTAGPRWAGSVGLDGIATQRREATHLVKTSLEQGKATCWLVASIQMDDQHIGSNPTWIVKLLDWYRPFTEIWGKNSLECTVYTVCNNSGFPD